MPYITKPDLLRVLPNTEYIDLITDSGDGADDTIWESAALAAIADMRSGLNGRYDTANIFNRTGSAREDGDHAIVLQHTLSLFVWYLYKKVNPDKVPDAIMQDVERIRLWHKGVADFKINPDLPTKTQPQQNHVLFGGDVKRNNPNL